MTGRKKNIIWTKITEITDKSRKYCKKYLICINYTIILFNIIYMKYLIII